MTDKVGLSMVLDVTRCGIKIDPRSLCQEPRDPGCRFNLCREHLLAVVRHGIDVGWAEPPVCDPTEPARQPKIARHDPVVYYLRFGDRIKIGMTTNLAERLRMLPHDEVLALEPGGYARERARHHRFAADRITGEWFTPSPALLAHIQVVRARHGDLVADRATLSAG